MSRRRKKNPLLMRIMLITLAAHAIALPIAAHFGAFDKLKKQFGEARVMLVPLPKQEKEKEAPKEKKAKPKVDKVKKSSAAVKRGGAAKPNPNLHKVEAVNTPGEGEGPTIEQGTKTTVGDVPTEKVSTGGTKSADSGSNTKVVTPPKSSTDTTSPPPPPPPTTTETKTVAPKHVPLYVEPEQDYSPQPAIPDDLRNDTLNKDFVAMVTVGPDGNVTDLKVTQSTGISELDDVATKTARQWRFKPATLDGAGVEGKVKLTIQFRVE